MSLSIYVYHRGLGSSAGLYISTHQLFFIICQLLSSPLFADRLIGSCMWDGERHLSELYMQPQQLHKQPHNRWRVLERATHTALLCATWIQDIKFVQWVKVIMHMKMIFTVLLLFTHTCINSTDSTIGSLVIFKNLPHINLTACLQYWSYHVQQKLIDCISTVDAQVSEAVIFQLMFLLTMMQVQLVTIN